MKQLKLILVLASIALAVFGCSKTPTENNTAATTTALPSSHQTAAATVATNNIEACLDGTDNMAGGLSSGSFSISKGGKTPPDSDWVLGSDGWYFYSDSLHYYIDTIKIRFTPDIWGGANVAPYPQATKVEYKYFFDTTTTNQGVTVTSRLLYQGLCQRSDTSSVIVSGNYNYSYTYTYSSSVYSLDLSYLWNCSFDNVNVTYADKSGHFTYSCTYPFYDDANPTAGVSHTTLTGEMKFAANGDGNLGVGSDGYAGYCATEGTTFVKYYSLGTSRYYTLLVENWAVQHTW
jgi:hypothetical protein